jgi:hypothetical protein
MKQRLARMLMFYCSRHGSDIMLLHLLVYQPAVFFVAHLLGAFQFTPPFQIKFFVCLATIIVVGLLPVMLEPWRLHCKRRLELYFMAVEKRAYYEKLYAR